MRVQTLVTILMLLFLGVSAVRLKRPDPVPETRTSTIHDELLEADYEIEASVLLTENVPVLTGNFIEEAAELKGSIVTNSLYEGEQVVTFLPAPSRFIHGAPFYPFTDVSGETYVGQILESYENSDGADMVSFNLAGEVTTVEAVITHVPYTLSVDAAGEVYIAEVVESCRVVIEEAETIHVEISHHEETEQPEREPVVIHPEVPEKPEYHEVTERPEHHEVIEKPEHHEVIEKPEHHEVIEKPEHHEVIEKPEHHEVIEKPEHHEVTEITKEIAELIEELTEIVIIRPEEEETTEEIPEFIIEAEATEAVEKSEIPFTGEVTTTEVEGETRIVLLPNTGDIIPNAPFVVIESEETDTTYIAQVIESYESSTGEHLVTINAGNGTSITVDGEIVETLYPYVPVKIGGGEVEIVEIIETTIDEGGDTVITIPTGNGETTEIVAEPIVDPSAVTPDQIICLPPAHAETEPVPTKSTPTAYQPPEICTRATPTTMPTVTPTIPTEIPTTTIPTPTPTIAPTPVPTLTPAEEELCEASVILTPPLDDPHMPQVINNTGVTTDLEVTSTRISGKAAVVLIPMIGDVLPNAPFEYISNIETNSSFVAQVLEAYESRTGENLVTINAGNGQSLTIEGALVETQYKLLPVVYNDDVIVVGVSDTRVDEIGDTIITVPTESCGDIEVIAEPIVEPTATTPDQIICLPPGHGETETAELSPEVVTGYEPPSTCSAAPNAGATPAGDQIQVVPLDATENAGFLPIEISEVGDVETTIQEQNLESTGNSEITEDSVGSVQPVTIGNDQKAQFLGQIDAKSSAEAQM